MPPIADSGRDYGEGEYYEVVEGGTVEVDGSASYDPDGDEIISYDWDMDNDGTHETPGVTAIFDTVALGLENPPTNRVYIFLKVVDEHGAWGEDRARVEIRDAAPTAAFSWAPEPQNENSPIEFTDESTSPVDDIVAWEWDFGGLGTSTDQNPSFTFADDGVYIVTLTVTDDDGSTDTISHDVTVLNVAPTVDAGDDAENYSGDIHELTVSFTDLSSNGPTSWDWTFGDGGASMAQHPTHEYADVGTYGVSLTATNPSPDLTLELTPVEVSPPGQATLTVTDHHPGPTLTPGLWYTIPITATDSITRTTSVALLVGGARVRLPIVMQW